MPHSFQLVVGNLSLSVINIRFILYSLHCFTSEILTYEVHTQSHQPRDAECQTESLVDLLNLHGIHTKANVDEADLARFLCCVEPMISKLVVCFVDCSTKY